MDGVGSIQLDIPDFRNSVLTHLNSLRVQGRLCDIIVQVEGHSFRAHKVVLAASSPYFRDHMSLSQMSTVSLSVIRNPSVFEQLLSFCYTGRLRLQLCDIISYLTAASFLQMQHIIDRCTQILEGIHLKISLSDLDDDVDDGVATATAGRRGTVVRGGGARGGVSPQRSERPRGGGVMEDGGRSPEEEGEGLVGSAGGGGGAGGGPILRINRAGQWYVETAAMMDSVHIKTEDEWMGGRADTQDQSERRGVAEEEDEEEEEGPAVMIDTSGRSSVGAKAAQPTSSFPETDSPTGSVVVVSDRQRAKSESPGSRMDEHRQSSSQGEEPMALEVGGYEEYLREQVGGDSRWFRYNPRLTCIYCCKSFNQKGSLDRHMRLHMGITPFVCRICGKKYTRKDQLEYHIRKHTGNKPFHCHMCGKSFPFQAILNQHFRKNHPGCTAPSSQQGEPQQAPHSVTASPETTTTSSSSAASTHLHPEAPTTSLRGGDQHLHPETGGSTLRGNHPLPETSSTSSSLRGGGGGGAAQHQEVSPSQEEAESGGGGAFGDAPQASVSTTAGPD